VGIWEALKTKGEKGGEEWWMSGPIIPVTLPKRKKVSAAQEKPWGLTLGKGHGGKNRDLDQQLDGGSSPGCVSAQDRWPWKRARVRSLVKLILY